MYADTVVTRGDVYDRGSEAAVERMVGVENVRWRCTCWPLENIPDFGGMLEDSSVHLGGTIGGEGIHNVAEV